MEIPRKLKTEARTAPLHPVLLLNSRSRRGICAAAHSAAASFTTVQLRKLPECPYVRSVEYYSPLPRKESPSRAATWVNPEVVMLPEISHGRQALLDSTHARHTTCPNSGAVTHRAGERAKREPSDRRRGPAPQDEPLPGSAVRQRPSSTKLYWALMMWLKGSIAWYVFFSPK